MDNKDRAREEEIVPPENKEPSEEWRAIKRAIDQFAGRIPSIGRHKAINNAHIAAVVARLDEAGDHEAADMIVWGCWWRALDRERDRFLATQARIDALREAADIAQGKANRIMDLMKADGKVAEARVSAQAACEEVAQEIDSLIPKEQKDAGREPNA